ncbi:MAG: nitroreductase family protein [Treponema sp.]|jgi:nitroreductase|nr:nitroreductase family protein [Treponema sp.]
MAANDQDIQKILASFNLADEEYLALDETEFRARFRERIHHTLEIQVYANAYRGGKPLGDKQADTVKRLVALWEKRGLSRELPEYGYAQKLLGFAGARAAGEPVDLSPFAPRPLGDTEREAFFTIVKERRSVREFTSRRVPDALIDRILEAGLWAAHSCNLQSIRYLVVREEVSPGLFRGSDVPGGPVHLVILQDERVYRANPLNPVRNRLLDAGAAAQNIALAAHAIGLEGVWLTFNDEIAGRLRKHYRIDGHISLVTYVDVGYGDQTPCPIPRLPVDEAVLGRDR